MEAPYGRVPVFVPSGAILPFGPSMQWSDEKQAENIRLYVYQGANTDGEFLLYEDENTNYGYEAGRYAMIPVSYEEASQRLTVGDCQGEFPGMLKDRLFTIVFVSPDNPVAYDPEAQGVEVKYEGKKIERSAEKGMQ